MASKRTLNREAARAFRPVLPGGVTFGKRYPLAHVLAYPVLRDGVEVGNVVSRAGEFDYFVGSTISSADLAHLVYGSTTRTQAALALLEAL